MKIYKINNDVNFSARIKIDKRKVENIIAASGTGSILSTSATSALGSGFDASVHANTIKGPESVINSVTNNPLRNISHFTFSTLVPNHYGSNAVSHGVSASSMFAGSAVWINKLIQKSIKEEELKELSKKIKKNLPS
mgnify:CR=1 FL=1